MYPVIGAMQMPAGFKYKEVLRRGRPSHEKWDSFFIKHPPMAPSRWAKIFAPFDALDGFDERIRAKEETYTERKELDEGEKEELNRKLCYLHTLTMNGRLARQNRPTVAITYFSPCTDIENDWYGCGGQYKTITMLPPSIPWSGDLRIRGKGDSLSSTAAWKPPVSGRSGRRAGRGAAASSPAAITSSGNTT